MLCPEGAQEAHRKATKITQIKSKRLIRTVWQIPDALDKVSTTKLIVGDKNVRYAKKCLSGKN